MPEKVKPPAHLGQKYIEIEIDENGESKIEVHGCTDSNTCKILTLGLERALGVSGKRVDTTKQGIQQKIKGG